MWNTSQFSLPQILKINIQVATKNKRIYKKSNVLIENPGKENPLFISSSPLEDTLVQSPKKNALKEVNTEEKFIKNRNEEKKKFLFFHKKPISKTASSTPYKQKILDYFKDANTFLVFNSIFYILAGILCSILAGIDRLYFSILYV